MQLPCTSYLVILFQNNHANPLGVPCFLNVGKILLFCFARAVHAHSMLTLLCAGIACTQLLFLCHSFGTRERMLSSASMWQCQTTRKQFMTVSALRGTCIMIHIRQTQCIHEATKPILKSKSYSCVCWSHGTQEETFYS